MQDERFEIEVEARGVDRVSALWTPAPRPEHPAVLLAHGAGLGMESPFMAAVAGGLVERGFGVLRFRYPYRERCEREGKRMLPPDPARVLEATHGRALEALLERTDGARPILAGKSLGARISTHLAAKGEPALALVLFGYPLHPAGKPERLRAEHFPAICQPALFLQGTRDALCDLELLSGALERYGGRATVEVVEDADHGFHVPRKNGRTDEEVLEGLLERVAGWTEEL